MKLFERDENSKHGIGEAPTAGPNDRNVIFSGMLLSALVLAFFYCADRYFFSTKSMAPIFRLLLMTYDLKTAWLTLGVCLAAASWTNPRPIFRVVDFFGAHPVSVAAAGVVLLALGTVFVYHDAAFSMDEYAAVFQSKIFAAGQLTAKLPPSAVDWLVPSGFNGSFIVASRTTGLAIEAYWPGFASILAIFQFLRVPWLCNASLAGLAIFLVHNITLQLTADRRAAGWAVLFTVASGTFAANAISYYSMQAHLTANLLFVWLLLKPTTYRALGAGILGSLALVLNNPFPHALFAAPWIVAIGFSQQQRRFFAPLILGYLPILILVGAGWPRLRGIVTSGDTGIDMVGTLITAVFSLPDKAMIDMRVAALAKMWVWAVPCLFVLALLGRVRRGDDPHVRLLAQSALLTFLGYIFVIFDQGHGWGYRYFHSAWGVIPVLAACAMSGQPKMNDRLAAFAGAAALLNLSLIVPYQMIQIDSIIAGHLAQLPKLSRPGNNVYFIRPSGSFYMPDLIQSDPLLRDEDLRLVSHGPEKDAELRRQNWPSAVLVASGPGVEQWNLGAIDQRSVDSRGIKRFVFAYADGLPR